MDTERHTGWGDISVLTDLLDVQEVGEGVYRGGKTPAFGREVVDGQQMLGQGVVAAAKAGGGKHVSSSYMIFNRTATVHEPVDFTLRPNHMGRQFGTYDVLVSQQDRIVASALNLLDNDVQDFISHDDAMPDIPGPDDCPVLDFGVPGREIRVVDGGYDMDPDRVGPPEIYAWVRYSHVPERTELHQALLAQFGGHMHINTAMRQHKGVGEALAHVTLSTANIALGVVYHRPVDTTRWHLYAHHSSHAGRGLTFGTSQVFQDGQLSASFSAQAMVREFANVATSSEKGWAGAM
jgi:acyl-CoA thioesterase-2